MIKREAQATVLFRHWLHKNPLHSCAFELKTTRGTDNFPFAELKEHQIDALLAVMEPTGLLYKAPDDTRGIKPFDLFYLRNAPAYVVIHYPRSFEIIPIRGFVLEKEKSKRKSLTYERAKEISTISVKLK